MKKTDEKFISSMLCDPFYCLPRLADYYSCEHQPIMNENTWKKSAVKFIEQNSPEEFVDILIENLKGNGKHLIESSVTL